MPSFSSLKSRADKISKASEDDEIKALADIVRYLAKSCDELEAKVKRAEANAQRAQNRAEQAMSRR